MRGEYGLARFLVISSGFGLLAAPLGVAAQSVPGAVDRDAQRIQEQQADAARERAQQFDQQQQRPPSGHPTNPEQQGGDASTSGCAAIREVRLVGVTRYRADDFAEQLALLKGSCTSISAINAALRAITNRYVADGYVTSRAFVGPQDLKGGILTITVIEGRLGGYKGAGLKPYRSSELGSAFPARAGEVLNLRALEQGVDQLARLGGGDPAIDIAPGDVPATSTVLVKRKPLGSWVRPAITVTNDGPASTGRLTGNASLDVDSPLGLADLWSLYYSRDLATDSLHGSHAYGGFVSVPHGWWTLSLVAGKSDYHSVLAGNGLSFVSNGESWNASATLDRMIRRDAKTKLSLSAGLALLDTKNFIQGIQLRTGSYRIVSARVDAHWQRRLGASLVAGNFGYVRGLGLLGANAPDSGVGGPTGQFNLVSADTSLQSRFAVGPTKFTNALVLRGQWGFDNLFPAQRFSLGGTSSVRGFRDDGISGRTGLSLREQLGFGIVDLAKHSQHLATSISGYFAYDFGAVRPNAYSPYERGLIQSGTIGVKAQSRHFTADLALSLPITAPDFVRHKSSEVLASLRVML